MAWKHYFFSPRMYQHLTLKLCVKYYKTQGKKGYQLTRGCVTGAVSVDHYLGPMPGSVERFIYYSSLNPAIRWIFLRQGRSKNNKDPVLILQKNPEHGLLALRLTPRPMSNHQCSNFTPVLSHSCCLPGCCVDTTELPSVSHCPKSPAPLHPHSLRSFRPPGRLDNCITNTVLPICLLLLLCTLPYVRYYLYLTHWFVMVSYS